MQSHDAATPEASFGAHNSHGSTSENFTVKALFSPDFAEFERLAQQGNLIPVSREVLADLETPVSAFLKLRDGDTQNDAFLLESVEGGEALARYSFLGVSSRASLITKGREVWKMGATLCTLWKNGCIAFVLCRCRVCRAFVAAPWVIWATIWCVFSSACRIRRSMTATFPIAICC
jgi:hypothetical protein